MTCRKIWWCSNNGDQTWFRLRPQSRLLLFPVCTSYCQSLKYLPLPHVLHKAEDLGSIQCWGFQAWAPMPLVVGYSHWILMLLHQAPPRFPTVYLVAPTRRTFMSLLLFIRTSLFLTLIRNYLRVLPDLNTVSFIISTAEYIHHYHAWASTSAQYNNNYTSDGWLKYTKATQCCHHDTNYNIYGVRCIHNAVCWLLSVASSSLMCSWVCLSSRRPAELPPSHHVYMKVVHWLCCLLSVIDNWWGRVRERGGRGREREGGYTM